MTTSLEDLSARSVDPTKPLLEVDQLVMRYKVKAGDVSAVEDVSFTIHEGEAVGLVGESGCGKTSVALSLLRLLPDNARFVSGEIRLDGNRPDRLDRRRDAAAAVERHRHGLPGRHELLEPGAAGGRPDQGGARHPFPAGR